MKRSRPGLAKVLAALSAVAAAALIFGCMISDPTGPKAGQGTSVPDGNQLAGATSSTNWPPEDAGSKKLLANVTFDSVFDIRFTDTLGAGLPLSGKLILYAGTDIPVFKSPDSAVLEFRDAPQVRFGASELSKAWDGKRDSAAFSILVRTDSLQCLITGFYYSKSKNRFINYSNPDLARFTYLISLPQYGVKTVPGDSLPLSALPGTGKKGWCLYIPASPYFFVVDSAAFIELGPLPAGTYPFRLLVFEPSDSGGSEGNRMTLYTVKEELTRKNPDWNPTLVPDQKIDEIVTKSSISLRPQL
jgi:hypothetical protein